MCPYPNRAVALLASRMSYGFLAGVLIHGAMVLLSITAPRRPRWLAGLGFRVASVYNEAPALFVYLILILSAPDLVAAEFVTLSDWLIAGLTLLLFLGFGYIAWQGFRARPALEAALEGGLGRGWRESVLEEFRPDPSKRPTALAALLMPLPLGRGEVERVANVSYGPAGRANLLDIYRHRSRPAGAPVLAYFHSGGYRGGRKSFEARELLSRLASQGWLTVSANYRLRPEAGFFEHLEDMKRVIAWIREHGAEYGADPGTLFLAGSSAGGHMAAIASQTQNVPAYQPGFEGADTSVSGAIGLYGWYGGYYGMGGADSEVGPLGHDPSGAPPFLIAHGTNDSLAHVETARRFADHLRAGSANPVVYAELPGAQHTFDLFRSVRFCAVVDAVEGFAAWVRSREGPDGTEAGRREATETTGQRLSSGGGG